MLRTPEQISHIVKSDVNLNRSLPLGIHLILHTLKFSWKNTRTFPPARHQKYSELENLSFLHVNSTWRAGALSFFNNKNSSALIPTTCTLPPICYFLLLMMIMIGTSPSREPCLVAIASKTINCFSYKYTCVSQCICSKMRRGFQRLLWHLSEIIKHIFLGWFEPLCSAYKTAAAAAASVTNHVCQQPASMKMLLMTCHSAGLRDGTLELCVFYRHVA